MSTEFAMILHIEVSFKPNTLLTNIPEMQKEKICLGTGKHGRGGVPHNSPLSCLFIVHLLENGAFW